MRLELPRRNEVKKRLGRAAAILAVTAMALTGCGVGEPQAASPEPTVPPTPVIPTPEAPTPAPTPARLEVDPAQYNEAVRIFQNALIDNLPSIYLNANSKLQHGAPCVRGELPSDAKAIVEFEVQTSQGLVKARLVPEIGRLTSSNDSEGKARSITVSLVPQIQMVLDDVPVLLRAGDSEPDIPFNWDMLRASVFTNDPITGSVRLISNGELKSEGQPLQRTSTSEFYQGILDDSTWEISADGTSARHALHPVVE